MVSHARLARDFMENSLDVVRLRPMVFRPRTGLFAFFFFAGVLLSAFSQSVTKTDRTADGAGAIVFDTSKLPELTGDEAVSLFDFSLGDKRVEFLAQGYWQSTISSTSTYTFGFGSTPGFSFGTPVFAQKVDLSLWFMLDRHWYFEADFADEFTKNTVAAGYVGDGVVQSVRIANRGITFPGIYAVDDVNRGIGGGDNQAPGLSVHLQGEKWQAHAAVRYDMLKSEEKTWYGKNAVSTNAIALSQYVTGSRYVLPSQEAVQAVRDVYVENANGSYRDAQGRTYKKLDASQYLLVPSSYTVLLAKDAGAAKTNGVLPAVAFRFDGMTADSVAASAADLIADVRAWFESDANPELADVTQFFFDLRTNPSAATAGEQFVSAIDGERVLFVQHSAGFSPFVVAYRYDAGLTTATDAAITSRQSDVTVTDYAAVIGEDDISFVSEDFFYTTHTYADVYCTDEPEADMRSAAVRFPLARADAGIYLGYGQHSDWELSVRTYTPVARFDIGTDAVPGTVRVYKNGILDSGATYDSESGSITLSSAVAASDHIYATWYEDSEDAESGAIAAAAGFAYRPTDTVTTDVSLAARWSLTPQKDFADADYTSPGFATLAGRISYEGEHLTLANTVAASVESENTTGTYRILGMDDTTADTVYLAKNAAVALPDGFVPVLNTRTETEPFPELTADKNGSQPAQDGLTDAAISGYAVPVAWNFSDSAGVTVDSPAWAAVAIRLPGAENSLASASTFSFWLKNPDATNADFSVYVQLGVEAADDVSLENVTTIPTWRVSTANGEANPADVRAAFYPALDPALSGTGGWQPVTVVLSDRDRARLAYYHDARIIITSQTASAGEILVGPYQADGVSFTVTHNAATMVSSCQTTDGTLVAQEVNAFNTGVNYVQQCTWKTYGEAAVERLSADDTFTLTFSRYFAEVDMQHYEELALWFQYNPQDAAPVPSGCMAEISDDALTLVLDRPADGGTDQTAVKITLHRSDLSASSLWHRLSVDMAAKTVQIDGVNVGSAYVNTAVVPVRFQVMLNTADAAQRTYYQSGTFAVDELFLDETQPYVVLQDKARAAWKKGGTVLEHNGAVILRDVLLAATGTGSRTIQTGGSGSDGGMLASTAQAAFTLAELRITGDAAFSSAATKPLASAAHTVATDTPLFGVIDISESYGYSAEDASLEKANAVSFDFATLGIPISMISGIIDDKFGTNKAAFFVWMFMVGLILCVIFMSPERSWLIYVATFCVGACTGCFPNINPSIKAYSFGRKAFVAANSVSSMVENLLMGLPLMYLALMFDTFGNYTLAYTILIFVTLIFGILMLFVKPMAPEVIGVEKAQEYVDKALGKK